MKASPQEVLHENVRPNLWIFAVAALSVAVAAAAILPLTRPQDATWATPASTKGESAAMPLWSAPVVNGAPANPAVLKFSRAISFYMSFNQLSRVATMSDGVGAPVRYQGRLLLRHGLYGHAMLAGNQSSITYSAKGNIDLSKSGSLAVWVTPYQWKNVRRHVPWMMWLDIKDHGRELIVAREGNRLNHEAVEFWGSSFGNKGKGVFPGSTISWQDGQWWHLLVVDWTPHSISACVDGKGWQQVSDPWLGHATRMTGTIKIPREPVTQQCLLDELMVFNRPLSGGEVWWLYRQGWNKVTHSSVGKVGVEPK
ncbi:MAG: hypothetical protein HKL95_09010 [Phycisphaerae bacterium]|nr:hypothetical protein [Phycisphaerae bacterium]